MEVNNNYDPIIQKYLLNTYLHSADEKMRPEKLSNLPSQVSNPGSLFLEARLAAA